MSTTLERPTVKTSPSHRRAFEPGKIFIALNCLALLGAAVWMRVWNLANIPGVNGDEAWSGVQALHALAGEPFAWRTPTGNPVNPFFFGPLLCLHALFAPSFVLLRSVAVVSGLAGLVVNFCLCRRMFGPRAARVSTLLLAALPVNIAYSRFAWDASQTLAATTLVTYLPLLALHDPARRLRWLSFGLMAFIAATLVHPTNVFIAPLVVVVMLYAYRGEIRRFWTAGGATRRGAACLALTIATTTAAWLFWPWLAIAGQRLVDPAQAGAFLLNYGRLLSGATVYRFLSGSLVGTGFDAIDLAGWWLIAVGLYGFYRLWASEGHLADRAQAIGAALSGLVFFLIAGPGALAPHFERYSIWMVAPSALVLARGACWFLLQADTHRRKIELGFVTIAWTLLCGFYANYFLVFERSGGLSHRAFQTASVEPKQQALEYVLSHRAPGKAAEIVTDEWWTYWPIAYLALGEANVNVSYVENVERPLDDRVVSPLSIENTWFVEFSDNPFDRALVQRLQRERIRAARTSIFDYAGRPVLTIYGPASEKREMESLPTGR